GGLVFAPSPQHAGLEDDLRRRRSGDHRRFFGERPAGAPWQTAAGRSKAIHRHHPAACKPQAAVKVTRFPRDHATSRSHLVCLAPYGGPMKIPRSSYLLPIFVAILLSTSALGADQSASVDWPYYGNDQGGQRYSPLDQINRDNVSKLKPAWTYHTGDVSNG